MRLEAFLATLLLLAVFPLAGGGKDKEPAKPAPSFSGTLKRLDEKSIVLEMDDNRVLDIRRTGKTRFFQKKQALDPKRLKPGDTLTVEALEDHPGFLTAVNVYLEHAAGEVPPPAPSLAAPPPAPAEAAEEPRTAEPGPEVAAATPAPAPPAPATVATPEPKEDPLIEKARQASESFSETLPNYVCQELMSRFVSGARPSDWQPVDVVAMDVVYDKGKEDYRNLKVNGKPVREGEQKMGGAWSSGEFGSMLRDLLSPLTAARFYGRRDDTLAGRAAVAFEYTVEQENSHWEVRTSSQQIEAAYRGSIWIDKETSRLLRIEMEAVNLPKAFPLDKVESASDYDFVRLGDAHRYLLPVHAETLSCERGLRRCSLNKMDFRNYHKYTGESSITFDAPK